MHRQGSGARLQRNAACVRARHNVITAFNPVTQVPGCCWRWLPAERQGGGGQPPDRSPAQPALAAAPLCAACPFQRPSKLSTHSPAGVLVQRSAQVAGGSINNDEWSIPPTDPPASPPPPPPHPARRWSAARCRWQEAASTTFTTCACRRRRCPCPGVAPWRRTCLRTFAGSGRWRVRRQGGVQQRCSEAGGTAASSWRRAVRGAHQCCRAGRRAAPQPSALPLRHAALVCLSRLHSACAPHPPPPSLQCPCRRRCSSRYRTAVAAGWMRQPWRGASIEKSPPSPLQTGRPWRPAAATAQAPAAAAAQAAAPAPAAATWQS